MVSWSTAQPTGKLPPGTALLRIIQWLPEYGTRGNGVVLIEPGAMLGGALHGLVLSLMAGQVQEQQLELWSPDVLVDALAAPAMNLAEHPDLLKDADVDVVNGARLLPPARFLVGDAFGSLHERDSVTDEVRFRPHEQYLTAERRAYEKLPPGASWFDPLLEQLLEAPPEDDAP